MIARLPVRRVGSLGSPPSGSARGSATKTPARRSAPNAAQTPARRFAPNAAQTSARIALLGAAVAVGLGLAGCGNGGAPAPVTSTAVDLVTRTGGFPAGQRTITAAEDRLVARCMAASGRTYIVSKPTSADAPAATDYGLYSAQHVDPSADRTTNDYYLAHLPEAERTTYLKALRGTAQAAVTLSDGREIAYPTTGCEPAARTMLYGSLENQVKVFYVPQIVGNAVREQVQQKPEYVSAQKAWQRCMASGHEPYSSSAEARKQIAALYAKTGPTPATHQREITVATLDRRCTTNSRLDTTESTLTREVLAALPEPDRQELDKLAATWRKTLEAARATP
ncbi:hypothetical protein FL583_31225 [Cryptosporangium phraense]|uniref:Uncharacterized protein n=1 Tax=Cryptosporangium phraense TaxID=2593070 RepID=A0A545AIQ5_9ACTN|nr:hypothetical protein FL583_31225 [Cryptosporangium phraense]